MDETEYAAIKAAMQTAQAARVLVAFAALEATVAQERTRADEAERKADANAQRLVKAMEREQAGEAERQRLAAEVDRLTREAAQYSVHPEVKAAKAAALQRQAEQLMAEAAKLAPGSRRKG